MFVPCAHKIIYDLPYMLSPFSNVKRISEKVEALIPAAAFPIFFGLARSFMLGACGLKIPCRAERALPDRVDGVAAKE